MENAKYGTYRNVERKYRNRKIKNHWKMRLTINAEII